MPPSRMPVSMDFTSWGGRTLVESQDTIPKIIWSYWHDDSPPTSVMAAQKSWALHAPDYEVRFLSRRTVEKVTGRIPLQLRKKQPTAIADWIRLQALSKYGGIWMDASLILFEPIETLLPRPKILAGQPFMYFNRAWSTDLISPMLENWLIAAPANSRFIRRLTKEYSLACISRKRYIWLMSRIFKKKILQDYPNVSYFTCFAAIQAVLLRNKDLTVSMADSEAGPFMLNSRVNYQPQPLIKALLSGDMSGVGSLKLTSENRNLLDKLLETQKPDPSSPLAALLPH